MKCLFSLLTITFFIASTDQMWKYIMLTILTYGNSLPIIEKIFSLTLVFNTGAAFGIFPDKKYLFLVLPVITVFLILFLFIKSNNKNNLIMPLALLLGGTIGNFIDRVRFGYVVDFFDFHWRTCHWPAFNIADACICMGIFLLILQILTKKPVN